MSSTIDNVECPECGKDALLEMDVETGATHTHCPICGYDSDVENGLEEYFDEDDFYGEDDFYLEEEILRNMQ